MNILYLTDVDPIKSSGVYKKLVAQSRSWLTLGHSVQLIVMPRQNFVSKETYVRVLKFKPSHSFSPVKNYLNRYLKYRQLSKEIKNLKIDIIYWRQSVWVPGLSRLLCTQLSIMELNTDDLSEKRVQGWLPWMYCKFTRLWIIDSVIGFVSVSNEIKELYQKYEKPITVISNGYDCEKFITKKPRYSQSRKQLIFVGSPGQPWHGVDKVLSLAEWLPEFDFNIVGPNISSTIPNVVCHGFLQDTNLSQLYHCMDIGIGTLALHRKGMDEASPLKVREYLAHGLPVVIGYKDTDLKNQSYVLNIGNIEDNVLNHWQEIREFVNQWAGKRVPAEEVNPLIDWEVKERQRMAFFQTLLGLSS